MVWDRGGEGESGGVLGHMGLAGASGGRQASVRTLAPLQVKRKHPSLGQKRDVSYLVEGAPGRCEKRLLRGKGTSGKGSVGPRAVITQDGEKGQRLVNDGGWG